MASHSKLKPGLGNFINSKATRQGRPGWCDMVWCGIVTLGCWRLGFHIILCIT